MNHSFDVELAVKYGVNAAILLNHIYFWVQKNRANKHNFFDGSYWTYNSRSAFAEIFPYLSERQVKTALDKLIADDVIKTGCYNKNVWDKSLWYTLTDKGWSIMQKGQIDIAEMSNRYVENVQPIPYINTDVNTDTSISRNSAESDSPFFAEFWKAYPRKTSKQMAIKSWKKLGVDDSESLLDTILADVRRRVNGEWAGKELQYVPHPSTYLNQRRWEDETATTDRVEAEEEHDLPLEEILRRGDDCSVPEGFTPCGGW